MAEARVEESIGKRVRRLRMERGLSQRQLAEPGVSFPYVSRIEADERRPSLKALRILARKLGVSMHYLETGEGALPAEQREYRLGNAELALRLDADLDEPEQVFREEIAAESVEPPLRARAEAGLGLLLVRKGRLNDAIPLLEAATGSGYLTPEARPDVWEVLGEALVATERTTRAVDVFKSCLDHARQHAPQDAALQARFAVCLAAAHSSVGAHDRARAALEEATEAAREVPLPQVRTRVYWQAGIEAWERADSETGLTFIRRAIGLLEAGEDSLSLARAHMVAGRMLSLDTRYEEAEAHLLATEDAEVRRRAAEREHALGALTLPLERLACTRSRLRGSRQARVGGAALPARARRPRTAETVARSVAGRPRAVAGASLARAG